MDYVLLALGIVLVAGWCWQKRNGRLHDGTGAGETKVLQEELSKARTEIRLLLDEINTVSEKVVNEISEKIREAENLKLQAPETNEAPKIDPAAETAVRIVKSAARKQAKREHKVIDLSEHKQTHEAAAGAKLTGSKFDTVYTLADLGYSISEIAKQLQKGKGEVELILSLRHKEENAQA